MKIVVFDVPAVTGGALSILNDFYKEAISHKNKEIEWHFILSTPKFDESKNVKIHNYPWIKKSWFHRLYFDLLISRKIVKKLKPDKIFSLQNTTVPSDIKQILYVHQAIPFSKYKIKMSESKKLWFYQNIISKLIFRSIKKADKVIVQTHWFKEACLEKTKANPKKISVVNPVVQKYNRDLPHKSEKTYRFFYPAAFDLYKNHEVIFEAIRILQKKTAKKFEVIFTIDENDIKNNKKLYSKYKVLDFPIILTGSLPHHEVLSLYKTSVLIFPSYIETFGLPLIEAKECNSIILVADEPYSREILNHYNNVYYFIRYDAKKLAVYMHDILTGRIEKKNNNNIESLKSKSLLEEVIKL